MSNQAVKVDTNATGTHVKVYSSGEFGRMLTTFRGQHLAMDAPAYAGGPGQAPTPAEFLFSAVGGCALGMFDLICARDKLPLKKCSVEVESVFTSRGPNEAGVSVFDKVTLKFVFEGISKEQAESLVNIYHANCPIYGSVKMASDEVITEFAVQ